MAEKRYYWIKLKEDFFSNKPIKKLRRMAGGDTYTIIYLKLLLLSLRNGGRIYFDGVEDTFVEELTLEIDESVEDVKFTVLFLQKHGLLEEITEKEVFLPETLNLTGSESQSAARVRRHRENKSLQCNAIPLQSAVNATTCNETVTPEKDIRERDRVRVRERDRVTPQQVADLYNEVCTSFPRLRSLSDTRKKSINARLKAYSLDDFRTLFQKAEASSFLKGSNGRDWSATFDWLIKDANMAKVLDGNYDDAQKQTAQSSRYEYSGEGSL